MFKYILRILLFCFIPLSDCKRELVSLPDACNCTVKPTIINTLLGITNVCIHFVSPVLKVWTPSLAFSWQPLEAVLLRTGSARQECAPGVFCSVRDSVSPQFSSGLYCFPNRALSWLLSIATSKSWPSGPYVCKHSLDTHLSWVTRAGALGIPVLHPLQHQDLATVSSSAGTRWARVAWLKIIIFVPRLIFGCLLSVYQTSCGRTVWYYCGHRWPKGIFSRFWSNLVSTGPILKNSATLEK